MTGQRIVRAAGAVLWRRVDQRIEVALVHRPAYDDWSLPKGKLEGGETPAHTAAREVAEETGWHARLSRRLGTVEYRLPGSGRDKTVTYFAAEALTGVFSANGEVDELRWLPLAEAARQSSYRTDRRVLDTFAALAGSGLGDDVRTVLLVRHAKAGKKADWTGDDSLRPLACAGASQARALRTLLPLFGAARVYTATPVRCRQTVQPVAAELGVPVHEEPLLGEDWYWDDPDAGVARLLEIAAGQGIAVACSQGGVIPDALETLTAGWAEPPIIRCKKASIWALFFTGGPHNGTKPRLLHADYYPSPLPTPAVVG